MVDFFGNLKFNSPVSDIDCSHEKNEVGILKTKEKTQNHSHNFCTVQVGNCVTFTRSRTQKVSYQCFMTDIAL